MDIEKRPNNPEQRRVLPEKYQGRVGRARFAVEYTVRAASLVARAAFEGYDSPVISKPPMIK